MPATVRGLYRPRRKGILAGGLPKVIGSHPFAQGLVALYVPGASVSADLFKTHRATTVSSVPPVIDSPGLVGSFANSSGAFLEVLDAADLHLATNFTILMRVKITATTGCVITKGSSAFTDGVGIRIESPNILVTAGASNVIALSFTPYFGAWIDLALVSTGSGSNLYVNGVSRATGSSLSSWFNSSTVLRIGAPTFSFFGSGTSSIQMLAASVALYNRALSASELQARYLNPFGFLAWPEDRRHYLVGVAAGGATSYSFPTAGWVWNHQAPTLAFASTSTQKAWVWNHQAPTLAFATAAAQKAWAWAKGAPSLGFASAATQKAWVWVGGAPILPRTIAAAQKAWRWAAASPTMTGGNFNPLAAVLRYLGPVWKRRRSRPPL